MPRKATQQHDFSERPLGYHPPPDSRHLELYPARAEDVNPLGEPKRPYRVVHRIGVRYDQGSEGACVGMAVAAWCSTHDYALTAKSARYDAFWIYNEAKRIDEWPGEAYSGTSTRAGLEVIRSLGAPRLRSSGRKFITEYRWATGVEDILNHVAFVGPVVCGLDWYTNFDRPTQHAFGSGRRQYFFIGEGNLGGIRGGHAIILNGYYRNRKGQEWVRFQNSWGFDYPLVWMPVECLSHLVETGAEAALVTGEVRTS